MFSRVLTVCVGNICRSPMAQAVLAHELSRHGRSARVESAGIGALVGEPADPIAQELMSERGLDIASHRARQLTLEIAAAHELILVMEAGHQKAIEAKFPSVRGRVHRLGRWGGFDVPDPYRGTHADFERALSLIDRGVADLVRTFWS
jgi:protein-tyrosine phosphatase